MQPEFPKIRLLLSNRLLESREDCLSTLTRSAYEFGLATEGSLDKLEIPEDTSLCSSVFVVSCILKKQLQATAGNNRDDKQEQRIEEICANLRRDIEAYKAATNLEHDRSAEKKHDSKGCSHMAPIVFDFLLQYLERYT